MTLDTWTNVDRYLNDRLIPDDPILDQTLAANRRAGLPTIDVTPNQGKLLMLLARMSRARTVLEIGTLGGYSTIWLARGLPTDGHLTTLEAQAAHATVARANIERAGFGDRVDIRIGPALDTLPRLVAEAAGPFDFVFIDADKQNIPYYLEWALRLTQPGSVIVVDNVIRDGQVIDPASPDERVHGVRAFFDLAGADPRLEATAVQTVGAKGWDGFSIAMVTGR